MTLGLLLWALIPGLGQIHHGRPGKGLLYFTAFALLLNAWLVSPLLMPDRVLRASLLAVAVLLWLVSLTDLLRVSCESQIAAQEESRD